MDAKGRQLTTRKQPALYEAAKSTVEAIESEDLPTIKKAGKTLAKAIQGFRDDIGARGKNQGRSPVLTDEQVKATMHMSGKQAGIELGVDASTVTRARKRLKEGN